MQWIMILANMTAPVFAAAMEPPSPAQCDPTRRGLEISDVAMRDAQGRPNTVLDKNNREFRYTYDANGRVESLKAIQGAHASDIVAVRYDGKSRLGHVRLQGGYELHFLYLTDGQQIARDRFGGLIGRTGSLDSGYTVVQKSDPTGKLTPSLHAIDRALSLAAGKEPATAGTP